jgi:hypothetical protein
VGVWRYNSRVRRAEDFICFARLAGEGSDTVHQSEPILTFLGTGSKLGTKTAGLNPNMYLRSDIWIIIQTSSGPNHWQVSEFPVSALRTIVNC